ncbi:hypothetical protein [Paraburkholderia acidisoli]|uniref:Lipoprotein n=1 Tax=Paraburkholderia acidisoli TaxID=2571748 RepID=A0A7Z2JG93_9BURK|nr:hypothetical protein [Paraburkholderia acidisoli]QGZ62723.1 hypothetical protein FAZ98_13860 [Paraburkholderia acidisoli]
MIRYHRILPFAAAAALAASLAACVVTPPAQQAGPSPHQMGVERLHQVDGRIDNLGHRIDVHVSQGYYPPPQGGALHHRLDTIRGEAHDMAAQHGGALTADEHHVLSQELDQASRAIGS